MTESDSKLTQALRARPALAADDPRIEAYIVELLKHSELINLVDRVLQRFPVAGATDFQVDMRYFFLVDIAHTSRLDNAARPPIPGRPWRNVFVRLTNMFASPGRDIDVDLVLAAAVDELLRGAAQPRLAQSILKRNGL